MWRKSLSLDTPLTLPISHVPSKVDLADLKDQDKILESKVIQNITAKYESHADGFIEYREKEDVNIFKFKGEYYAEYKASDPSKSLGEGSFARVRLMQHLETGEWIAQKVQTSTQTSKNSLDKEVAALEKIGELKYHHTVEDKKTSEKQYYTGMALAQGTPLDRIEFSKKTPPVRIFDLTHSMLTSLKNVHNKGTFHCDVKNSNMMRSAHGIKVIDFGFATPIGENKESKSDLVGTRRFMAPELRREERKNAKLGVAIQGTYSEKTEVYALGVTIAKMLNMEGDVTGDTFGLDGMMTRSPIADSALRESVITFLKKMTGKKSMRPTLDEAIEFFQKIREFDLRASALVNRVICLDIETFNKSSEQEKKITIQSLKKADEVLFIDKNGENKASYIGVKRLLEDRGLLVMDDVLQYSNKSELSSRLQAYGNKREREDKNIYLFGSLNKESKLVFPEQVSKRHLDKIVHTLRKDIERLEKRYPGALPADRIKKIESFIQKLQDAESLTYTQLDNDFTRLRNDLFTKSTCKLFAEKYLGMSMTESVKTIRDLQKEAKDMHRFKR